MEETISPDAAKTLIWLILLTVHKDITLSEAQKEQRS